MKSPTEPYKKLRKALRDLKPLLARMPLHECRTQLHHLKVQSFVVLAHAAFEDYLEDLSRACSDSAIDRINTAGTITRTLVCMIASEVVAQIDEDTPRKKIKADVASDLQQFANCAKVNHVQSIKDNNGIRTANLKHILTPIGVDAEECDLPTANALNAFGVKRGSIAHSFVIQTAETKSSVQGEVETIFKGLLNFDRRACECLAEGMSQV